VCREDGSAEAYDLATGAREAALGPQPTRRRPLLSDDGVVVLLVSAAVELWDPASPAGPIRHPDFVHDLVAAQLTADGRLALVQARGEARVWEIDRPCATLPR
ncbi:MAG TPA: hypothetical protein VN238_20785, partial [Solirubrobacteraceae bacterium]|nr:hypothetical protein [Solirubrobacteraceae bacterium]